AAAVKVAVDGVVTDCDCGCVVTLGATLGTAASEPLLPPPPTPARCQRNGRHSRYRTNQPPAGAAPGTFTVSDVDRQKRCHEPPHAVLPLNLSLELCKTAFHAPSPDEYDV
ncbi:MAG: hypothetical protein ACK5S1_01995, partial [bacterium]